MANTVIMFRRTIIATNIYCVYNYERYVLCAMLFNVELGDIHLSSFLVSKHLLSQMGGCRGGGYNDRTDTHREDSNRR